MTCRVLNGQDHSSPDGLRRDQYGNPGRIFNLSWVDRLWGFDRGLRRQDDVRLPFGLDNFGTGAGCCRPSEFHWRGTKRPDRILRFSHGRLRVRAAFDWCYRCGQASMEIRQATAAMSDRRGRSSGRPPPAAYVEDGGNSSSVHHFVGIVSGSSKIAIGGPRPTQAPETARLRARLAISQTRNARSNSNTADRCM